MLDQATTDMYFIANGAMLQFLSTSVYDEFCEIENKKAYEQEV